MSYQVGHLAPPPHRQQSINNKKFTDMMITYKQLKEFTQKCNVRFELNPWFAEKGYYNLDGKYTRPQIGWYFGMNNISGRSGSSEYQWTWFNCLDDELTDESIFMFAERYSQVIGKSYKGWRESFRATDTIERRLKN
jgi:hypothetical protein